MLRRVYSYFFLLLMLPASLGCAESEQYKAGVDYEVLPQAVRTANPNKIEVNEVFAYYVQPLLLTLKRFCTPGKRLSPTMWICSAPQPSGSQPWKSMLAPTTARWH